MGLRDMKMGAGYWMVWVHMCHVPPTHYLASHFTLPTGLMGYIFPHCHH